jgi:5-formyltetrahydrofolate cyclo-ligase
MTLKAELRAELRARRRAWTTGMSAADRRRLEYALRDRVLEVSGRPGIAAGYHAIGGEIDPAPTLVALADRGAALSFPRVQSIADAMCFHRWNPDDPVEAGLAGIMQPLAQAPIVAPDLVLVPLVGADHRCNRLGQGAGHYDRALRELRDRIPCRFIGLAWDIQIVDQLPADSWDMPLDLVVTPTRILG